MKHLFLLLIVASFFHQQSTFAAQKKNISLKVPKFYCLDGRLLLKNIASCESNGLYTQAAKACQLKIEKEAQILSQDMVGGFSKLNNNNQRQDQTYTAADYLHSIAVLEYLISISEVARAQAYGYKELLVIPEDAEEDQTNKASMKIPCFGDNDKALDQIENAMDKNQASFEVAVAVAKKNLAIAKTNEQKSENIPQSAVLKNTAVAPAAPVGGKKPIHKNSDISGTEDPKNKPKTK